MYIALCSTDCQVLEGNNTKHKSERMWKLHPVTAFVKGMQSKKEDKDQKSIHQAPHLTQDTNRKVTTSQLDITNESLEVNPFPAGDHKASTNRRA